MAQEWNIRPRAAQCSACSEAFAEGQVYNTRLTFTVEGYTRGDFCEACWEKECVEHPGYSSWKGVFRTPPMEQDHRVRKETAENLLRELIARDASARQSSIYILAVMLERQKVFVEREVRTTEDSRRLVVYEHKRTGESFAIVDPELKLSEVEPVQREIMELLSRKHDTLESSEALPPPNADSHNA